MTAYVMSVYETCQQIRFTLHNGKNDKRTR